MSADRSKLLAVLDELDQAITHAAAVLESSRAVNRDFRRHIEQRESVRDSFLATAAQESMGSVAAALKRLEETRHRSRITVITAGLDEGLSIGELGRLYGFSRQLAQRFAKEAREQGRSATATALVATRTSDRSLSRPRSEAKAYS